MFRAGAARGTAPAVLLCVARSSFGERAAHGAVDGSSYERLLSCIDSSEANSRKLKAGGQHRKRDHTAGTPRRTDTPRLDYYRRQRCDTAINMGYLQPAKFIGSSASAAAAVAAATNVRGPGNAK